MYEILLGVDDEPERAEHAAQAVANLPGDAGDTHVTVFHCFQDNPSGASATQVAGVRAAVDVLEEAGFEPDVRESSGDPADAILEFADELDSDLVVVGGRKRSPAGKALFGSVTQQVILNANRPVMVTGGQ